ncbi:hypothetical protein KCV03_g338, partial [Aureobasidium melanogenum]
MNALASSIAPGRNASNFCAMSANRSGCISLSFLMPLIPWPSLATCSSTLSSISPILSSVKLRPLSVSIVASRQFIASIWLCGAPMPLEILSQPANASTKKSGGERSSGVEVFAQSLNPVQGKPMLHLRDSVRSLRAFLPSKAATSSPSASSVICNQGSRSRPALMFFDISSASEMKRICNASRSPTVAACAQASISLTKEVETALEKRGSFGQYTESTSDRSAKLRVFEIQLTELALSQAK